MNPIEKDETLDRVRGTLKALNRVCDALGITDQDVRAIHIRIDMDGRPTAIVERILDETRLADLCDAVEEIQPHVISR